MGYNMWRTMTNLSIEFCNKVREERRKAGLSQSALAAEVGCKQSALSGFEQGDGTKLNDETVRKLSEKFGIPLEEAKEAKEAAGAVPRPVFPPISTTKRRPPLMRKSPGCVKKSRFIWSTSPKGSAMKPVSSPTKKPPTASI